MAGTYTRWYREGTVKLVNGSASVVGTNTFWLTAGLNPGDIFSIDGVSDYEISAITDNTHLTLKTAFNGSNDNASQYHIIRNFTAHVPSQIASQLSELYSDLMRYWDQDTQTLHGKSAFEIAKAHGFTGNETAWLESLKAGGDITLLNNRTNILTYHNEWAHNSFFRGKNLGNAITAAQIANIRNGTYEDLYPGDYWELPIDGTTTATIMGCSCAPAGFGSGSASNTGSRNITVWLQNSNWTYPMNDTDTCEGHLYNSKLFTETFPALLAKLEAVIPSDYIRTFDDNIADSIDSSGKPNHSTRASMRMFLPSAYNLNLYYGTNYNFAYQLLSAVKWPFAVFRNMSRMWSNFWLDSSASASYWLVKPPQSGKTLTVRASSSHLCSPYIFLG